MLAILEDTTERAVKTRSEGLAKLKQELTVHEKIEEEIFYPALKEHPKTKDIALEAYEEHHVVDLVMGEIETTEPSDETWMAKFKVLKENLEHHIEEEEGEMFKQAQQVFDDEELKALGQRMQDRKEVERVGRRTAKGSDLGLAPAIPRLAFLPVLELLIAATACSRASVGPGTIASSSLGPGAGIAPLALRRRSRRSR